MSSIGEWINRCFTLRNATQHWKKTLINATSWMGSKSCSKQKKSLKKKSVTKEYIVYYSTYMKFCKRQGLFIVTERRSVLACGWGGAVWVQKSMRELSEVIEMFYIKNMDPANNRRKPYIKEYILHNFIYIWLKKISKAKALCLESTCKW